MINHTINLQSVSLVSEVSFVLSLPRIQETQQKNLSCLSRCAGVNLGFYMPADLRPAPHTFLAPRANYRLIRSQCVCVCVCLVWNGCPLCRGGGGWEEGERISERPPGQLTSYTDRLVQMLLFLPECMPVMLQVTKVGQMHHLASCAGVYDQIQPCLPRVTVNIQQIYNSDMLLLK